MKPTKRRGYPAGVNIPSLDEKAKEEGAASAAPSSAEPEKPVNAADGAADAGEHVEGGQGKVEPEKAAGEVDTAPDADDGGEPDQGVGSAEPDAGEVDGLSDVGAPSAPPTKSEREVADVLDDLKDGLISRTAVLTWLCRARDWRRWQGRQKGNEALKERHALAADRYEAARKEVARPVLHRMRRGLAGHYLFPEKAEKQRKRRARIDAVRGELEAGE